jgi:hypothetical protein
MLQLRQNQSLQQRLTPQQVQYLKLLQLPILALEQKIKSELEENPMLEESGEEEEREDRASEDTSSEAVDVSYDGSGIEPASQTADHEIGTSEARTLERAETERAREQEEHTERDERIEPANEYSFDFVCRSNKLLTMPECFSATNTRWPKLSLCLKKFRNSILPALPRAIFASAFWFSST